MNRFYEDCYASIENTIGMRVETQFLLSFTLISIEPTDTYATKNRKKHRIHSTGEGKKRLHFSRFKKTAMKQTFFKIL